MQGSTIRSIAFLGLFIAAAAAIAAAQPAAPQAKKLAGMPHHATPYTMSLWRYARAMALTATGRLDDAEQALEAQGNTDDADVTLTSARVSQ